MYTLITVLACLNIAGAAADTFLMTVSVKKTPHKAVSQMIYFCYENKTKERRTHLELGLALGLEASLPVHTNPKIMDEQ